MFRPMRMVYQYKEHAQKWFYSGPHPMILNIYIRRGKDQHRMNSQTLENELHSEYL